MTTIPLPFTPTIWASLDPAVRIRIFTEYEIVASLVDELLAQNLTISIKDTLSESTDRTRILSSIMSTDEEYLVVRDIIGVRWVFLVYGNDGWDVLSDYSTSLEPNIPKTLALIDRLGG